MALTRNNLLFYYAPLTTVGGVNGVLAAIGIVSKFDMMVVKPHVGADQVNLEKIILGLKAINPSFKVFGWTDLGNAADFAAWQAQVTQWQADLPAGYLNGIYIDNFGYDFATSTRANQNAAVTACHTAQLSAFVNATSLIDVMGQLDGETEPVIGRAAAIKDYVLLNNFFYNNENSATPTLESKEQLQGRLKYIKGAKKKTTGEHNVSVAALVGAGTATQVSTEAYAAIISSLTDFPVDYLAVAPFDIGATSNKYFYKGKPNTFAD